LSAPEPAKRLAKRNPKYFDEDRSTNTDSGEPLLKKKKNLGKKVIEKKKTVSARKKNIFNPGVSNS
jgi:hypothetical protein